MSEEQSTQRSTDMPTLLNYGKSQASHSRRVLQITILVSVTVFLSFLGWWVVHGYWPQWVAYRGQQAIEAVVGAPGAVLYSEDPSDVLKLNGQKQYETATSQAVAAVKRLSEWYTDPGQPNGRWRSGMPPIGLRRVPGGPWRLIALGGGQYGTRPDGSRNFLFPEYDVCTRVTLWPGTRHKQLWYGINGLAVAPTDRVTLRAGQLDPHDESHFTFDYTINGSAGTVDAYLGTDDNVTFKIRSGPATTRPYTPRFGRQAFP